MLVDPRRKELIAWAAIVAFLCFGTANLIARRARPPGPVEVREVGSAPDPSKSRAGGRAAPPDSATPDAALPAAPATPLPEAPPGDAAGPGAPAPDASVSAGLPAPAPGAGGGKRSSTKKSPPSAPIDLNAATAEQLETLPGIGPGLAAKIVAFRLANGAFVSIDGLRGVAGIGPKRFAALAPFLTVAPTRH